MPGAVIGILFGGYCLRHFQLTRRGKSELSRQLTEDTGQTEIVEPNLSIIPHKLPLFQCSHHLAFTFHSIVHLFPNILVGIIEPCLMDPCYAYYGLYYLTCML